MRPLLALPGQDGKQSRPFQRARRACRRDPQQEPTQPHAACRLQAHLCTGLGAAGRIREQQHSVFGQPGAAPQVLRNRRSSGCRKRCRPWVAGIHWEHEKEALAAVAALRPHHTVQRAALPRRSHRLLLLLPLRAVRCVCCSCRWGAAKVEAIQVQTSGRSGGGRHSKRVSSSFCRQLLQALEGLYAAVHCPRLPAGG